MRKTNLVVNHLIPRRGIFGRVRDLGGEPGNATEDVVCGISALAARDGYVAQICDVILEC